MATPIDTTKVTERRTLDLEDVDACIAEVERIRAADASGSLQTLGNWTPGEIMSHVAAWIEYGYEGYPMKKLPFFIRWFLYYQMKKYLKNGMPAGAKLPGVEGGTYGFEKMETQAACERLIGALKHLKSNEAVSHDSPAFGAMSDEDRIKLNLRHAELHLSFFQY